MDPSFSLDHRWWLQFQPDVYSGKNYVCEYLDADKSDVTGEDLWSIGTTYSGFQPTQNGCGDDKLNSGFQPTQNGCGDDKLCSPIPLFTNPEFTMCDNVHTCGQNQIEMSQPLEEKEGESTMNVVEKITGNNIDVASVADTQEEVWTKNKLMDSTGLERSLNYYLHSTTTKCYEKGGIAWRKADQRELASIVAIKSAEHLQNCDLPPPQSIWLGSGPSESSEKHKEKGICMPQDRGAITSSSRSPSLEEKALNSFLLSGHSPLSTHVLEPPESPVLHKSSSAHFQERNARGNDRTSCPDRNTESLETDYSNKLDILEALRRSQTRAREAEKIAALLILEREKLLSLCIREASHTDYYRQWLTLLQIENSKLSLQLKVLQSKDQGSVTCDSCEALNNRKVVTKQDICCLVDSVGKRRKKIKKSNSRKNVSWGLAVTLGFSLAGAGLILGWSMGWIFPSL